ncbi:MAG: histidine phosphatase family protein [Planctomycetaceae bacterium]
MPDPLPVVFLARHGETEWSVSGRHTGLTDIPLTARGERNARRLGERLRGLPFSRVLTSPLTRAKHTCELAGFGKQAQIDADLVEWNYGAYEGLKTAEIRRTRPEWRIFRDGCPDGEGVAEISGRADRVVARLRAIAGNVLVFSSAHFLRVLAARWCGWPAAAGAYLFLETATLSALGYEHNLDEPVIRLWNDGRHVGD